ncbi:MAG TPA: hypothetical protein VGM03_21315, partial [Phycisphaerae bacterium]
MPFSQPAASQPADESEIERLIAQLSDASYEKRTEATRRLCAVGPAAIPALRRAAAGDEYETALRARNLLRTFEQVYFSGVEIRLAVSKEQIDWDEPVDLVLTLVNRSSAPARIPFEKPGRREESGDDPAVARGVREVAELLDIGDFLSVTAPDGEEVELRVDDISSNPFIAA